MYARIYPMNNYRLFCCASDGYLPQIHPNFIYLNSNFKNATAINSPSLLHIIEVLNGSFHGRGDVFFGKTAENGIFKTAQNCPEFEKKK